MNTVSVEQAVKRHLDRTSLRYTDNTTSFKKPDFTVWFQETPFFLEVKEKRQAYNAHNWPAFVPEADLFILDDLTVRKCLGYAPRAGVLVRNNLDARYFFFSVIDLALMPKLRVNRPINRNAPELKGKWLVNLQNGFGAATLDGAFAHIQQYLADLPAILFEHHPCYGEYIGEEISSGGVERIAAHWITDFQETR
jgi:hypothetical protein